MHNTEEHQVDQEKYKNILLSHLKRKKTNKDNLKCFFSYSELSFSEKYLTDSYIVKDSDYTQSETEK